ncbi:filamentous hemagglutinin N-terminal domain-containing protein [Anabaena sp. 4-3]|uniref:two-partner secretion domain-containing protein n=2 Tax=unclassified Anabaena TaxID=2619674 RepID=UPI0009EDB7B2|nr:filamentous hemagglutinin N-terminal domain-containing protein [Anabaena sp. 4-3]
MSLFIFKNNSKQQLCIWMSSLILLLLNTKSTTAEIIPDTTLPINSTVTPADNIRIIEGGTQRGENLFHSFQDFSFSRTTRNSTGDTALFNHDLTVQNIITRVTGSLPSRIDGLIQTRPGSTANLFLINPRGIILGTNAILNIGGSFIATTANSVKFADGREFSANNPEPSALLTISVPVGLQFGNNPGAIVQPISPSIPLGLEVSEGKTLALIGGDVSLTNSFLAAPGGRIELGSVTNNSFVSLNQIEQGYALEYTDNSSLGNIQLTGGTVVDASDFPILNRGGAIQIQGRNITLDDALVFAVTFGSTTGENLVINARESLTLNNNANIATASQGEGKAGDIFIKSQDTIALGSTSFIGSQVCPLGGNCGNVTGNGGNVTVETRRLLLQDGGGIEVSTFGRGNTGNILVTATDSINLIGETPDGDIPSGIFAQVDLNAIANAGNSGNITLETRNLTIANGAQISNAARYRGRGGNITINAADSILISGASPFATTAPVDIYRSGIFVSAQPGATNNVGSWDINTKLLTVENGGRITADNFGAGETDIQKLNVSKLIIRDGGEIRTGVFSVGAGGSLIVKATDGVEITGSGRIADSSIVSSLSSRSEGEGKAGNLIIDSRSLLINEGAEVTVSSQVNGEAGNLEITAREVKLEQGNMTASGGGNITLNLRGLLQLRHNSQIFTSAGGDIAINSPFIVAFPQENNDITANAQGGRVTINSKSIFGLVVRSRDELEQILGTTDLSQLDTQLLTTNDVTAFSQPLPSVNAGVTINTPDVEPSQRLVSLPTDILSQPMTIDCHPASGVPQSDKIMEAQGWVVDAHGNIVLVAQKTTNYLLPWLSSAACHVR